MFDFLKMGGADPMKMLKPMLPKLMKEVVPKITKEYKNKVEELRNTHHLDDPDYVGDDVIEVVPFPTIREGSILVQWVALRHQEGEKPIIDQVLAQHTMQELLDIAKNDVQLADEYEEKKPKLIQSQRHDQYFFEKYVVIKQNNRMTVIEAPADEGVQVFYGHPDEQICQNWADEANRQRL
jgi:hypothetical protein